MKIFRKLVYVFYILIFVVLLETVQFLKLFHRTRSLRRSLRIVQLKNLVIEYEDTCSDWNFSKKIQVEKKPQIVLDPNRFLYPGLIGGPNNQILGLQQSIYLTIRLNRFVKNLGDTVWCTLKNRPS